MGYLVLLDRIYARSLHPDFYFDPLKVIVTAEWINNERPEGYEQADQTGSPAAEGANGSAVVGYCADYFGFREIFFPLAGWGWPRRMLRQIWVAARGAIGPRQWRPDSCPASNLPGQKIALVGGLGHGGW